MPIDKQLAIHVIRGGNIDVSYEISKLHEAKLLLDFLSMLNAGLPEMERYDTELLIFDEQTNSYQVWENDQGESIHEIETDPPIPVLNTRIQYRYRDASNNKTRYVVRILKGELSENQIYRLLKACPGGQFVAKDTGLTSAGYSLNGFTDAELQENPFDEFADTDPITIVEQSPTHDVTAIAFFCHVMEKSADWQNL